MTDYEFTDEIIGYIDRQLIRIFARMRSILPIDDINVLEEKNAMFRKTVRVLKRAYLILAQAAYKEFSDPNIYDPASIDEQWLDSLMEGYDEMFGYVFINEIERRAAKFAEAYIAAPAEEKQKKVEDLLRSISLMSHGFAIRVTDEAQMKAFRDSNVPMIEWIAEMDNRTCSVCWQLNGQIYPLNAVPKKPHFNCRCRKRRVYVTASE